MANETQIPAQIANQLPPQFVLWLKAFILSTVGEINDVDSSVSNVSTSLTSLSDAVDLKAGEDHNHNLNDLVEKSYTSLDDKPEGSAGPSDVSAVSSISCSAGDDTIDMSAFNTALGILVTEINAIRSGLNTLKSTYDDMVDTL